ncbi:hypothetical protein AEST_25320 [Alishewanella aestuarii B11]|uniref:Uncharacterized protein n=2 Tax=Alishewanella aestuarii TaxID=453835 RepID=J2ID43_9ALTE|nr:hypothetical protein AEST_25320 [Alishewanella aestuarii B11]
MIFDFINDFLGKDKAEQEFNESKERSTDYQAYRQGQKDMQRFAVVSCVLYIAYKHGPDLIKAIRKP